MLRSHEPHCPVPRAEARGEGAVCCCRNDRVEGGLYIGLRQSDRAGNDCQVIAAGPLTKQPATMPHRIVLLRYGDGAFSVHHEYFETLGHECDRCWFAEGHYFRSGPDGFVAAQKKFAERVAACAEMAATIYREDP